MGGRLAEKPKANYRKPRENASEEAKENYALYLFKTRILNRDREHPGWRQTYEDCSGMCQYPDPEYGICGSIDELEFHEPFGEVKNSVPKALIGIDSARRPSLYCPQFQQRVLLCRFHHSISHIGRFPLKRANQTMLHRDVDAEVIIAGGLDEWRKKFGVIKRV